MNDRQVDASPLSNGDRGHRPIRIVLNLIKHRPTCRYPIWVTLKTLVDDAPELTKVLILQKLSH